MYLSIKLELHTAFEWLQGQYKYFPWDKCYYSGIELFLFNNKAF